MLQNQNTQFVDLSNRTVTNYQGPAMSPRVPPVSTSRKYSAEQSLSAGWEKEIQASVLT